MDIIKETLSSPFQAIYTTLFIYFTIPFLILIGLGIYFIYFILKNKSKLRLFEKVKIYFSFIISLIALGVILRIIIPDRDYSGYIMRLLHNLAYAHLSLTKEFIWSFFLFEFIVPLAFLVFVCSLLVKDKISRQGI